MAAMWIVQVSAEAGERAFNAVVCDDDRTRAEATAEGAVRNEGWVDVQVVRSGRIAEENLEGRSPEFLRAIEVAREIGWAVIVYAPTN